MHERPVCHLYVRGWRTKLAARTRRRALDGLTEEVDSSRDKMKAATEVMKKMLKNKDRGKLCAILVLTLVFILLAYAVLAW